MRRGRLAAAMALVLAPVCACTLLFPFPDDATRGHPDGGAEAASTPDVDRPEAAVPADAADAGFDAEAEAGFRCPALGRGPELAPVDGFCIDETEVTVAQYEAFLDGGADVAAQPAVCAQNYAFDLGFPTTPPSPNQPALVDWCDAYAFCHWAGKRLCGDVDGGPLTTSDAVANRFRNQWLKACTGDAGTVYPYGNDFMPDACAPSYPYSYTYATLADAGSNPECAGAYPGLLDLVGNAIEWIDACDLSFAGQGCIAAGVAQTGLDSTAQCRGTAAMYRLSPAPSYPPATGFRCCWPP